MITTKMPFKMSEIESKKTPKLPPEFAEFDNLLGR